MHLRHLLFLILGLSLHSAAAQETLVLQLKWHPQFQFAGYYVAQQMGFYEEAGLSVKIRPGGPGFDAVTEVVEGRAHFGISSSNLLAEHIKGAPVKALSAIFQNSPARFITLKSSGIDTAEKLRGKRVMLLPQNASFELLTLLNQARSLDSVVRQDSSYSISALINGMTDAFNGYVTNEPYQLQVRDIEYNLIDPADYGIRFYADVLFTSNNVASSKPGLVRAFVQASLRGWEYALANPSEAIDIVAQFAPEKTLSHLRYEALSMHSYLSKDLVPIGYMNAERWLAIKDYLVGIGEIPTDAQLNLDTFIFPVEEEGFNWERYGVYLLLAALLVLALIGWAIWAHRQKELAEEALEQTFSMATHDPLTGLANRYLFIDRFEQVLAHKERNEVVPMLAFIDLDKFKSINDTYGHSKGDEFLKLLSEEMLRETRPSDTLARIGGDEFALLVDSGDPKSRRGICERLFQAVNRAAKTLKLDHLGVSVSIGAVVLDSNLPDDPETLLALADREMYAAKCSETNSSAKKVRISALSILRGSSYEISG